MSTSELAKRAARVYGDYLSGGVVARQLGISHTHAYRLLREANVCLPGKFSAEVNARKKKLQGETSKQVALEYGAGASILVLRNKYGVGKQAIFTAVKDNGVSLRNRGNQPKKFSDKEIDRIIFLYTVEKLSQEDIAARLHCSQSHVSHLLLLRGIAKHKATWSGGRTVTGDGYIRIWVDPSDELSCMRQDSGYVLEHRLTMARHLGRPLRQDETVHHIDGNRSNNEISNLQIRNGRHGKGIVLQCADCGSRNLVPAES
jgi:AraC-like DNA-binding protein